MKTLIGSVGLLVLLASGCQGKAQNNETARALPQASHDGRFNSQCNARAGDIDFSFCRISFFQLLGNSERYDGERVEFVAYAAVVNAKVLLFPTEDLSRQWDLSSAVEIRSMVREGPVSVGWIKVNGVFSAIPKGRGDQFLGGLREVRVY